MGRKPGPRERRESPGDAPAIAPSTYPRLDHCPSVYTSRDQPATMDTVMTWERTSRCERGHVLRANLQVSRSRGRLTASRTGTTRNYTSINAQGRSTIRDATYVRLFSAYQRQNQYVEERGDRHCGREQRQTCGEPKYGPTVSTARLRMAMMGCAPTPALLSSLPV